MTLTDFKLFLVAATYHVLVQKRWVSIFCYIDQSKFTLHMWFISDLKELLIQVLVYETLQARSDNGHKIYTTFTDIERIS